MQDSKTMQAQLAETNQEKIENLIALIKEMIKVDNEETVKELEKLFKEHKDRIRVRLNLGQFPNVNTDIIAITAVLFPIRIKGSGIAAIPCLKITKNGGEKSLYYSPSVVVGEKLLAVLIQSLNAPLELCFFEIPTEIKKEPWDTHTINEIYRPKIREFYALVHNAMVNYLLGYLQQNKLNVQYAHTNNDLLLISVGCGDGKDLSEISKQLPDLKVSLAGFDINPKNIVLAQKNLSNSNLFQGDIKDIARYLTEIKKWFRQNANGEEPQRTIVIFSGILQRHLLKGTVEAAQYLQWACRHSQLTMMSSIQHTLTTRSIVKAIGFNINMQNIKYTSTYGNPETRILYCLERQTHNERLQYIIKRSNKRNPERKPTNIDLSLSANPLGDLILIISNQPLRLLETKQLDLSWSNFAENELEAFIAIISEKLPNLEKILIANVEPWAKSILEKKLPYTIYQRKDVLNEYEVPEFSVPSARFFKLYKTLPVVVIQEKPKNAAENNSTQVSQGLTKKSAGQL